MKLVWTYSDGFKKGIPNKNTIASHDYIQYLYRKSIKEAPDSYEKIVFTDKYNFKLFEDLDVKLIPAPKKDFIFLDDLKFDAAEIIEGEFIITDGDLFIKEELKIPSDYKIGFECRLQCNYTYKQKVIMQNEGIGEKLDYWKGDNKYINNLGLMYFNDDLLKNELIKEYRNTQLFFSLFIDKKYKINEKDLLYGSVGCCMFTYEYLKDKNIPTFYFAENILNKYNHLGGEKKLIYLKEYYKTINKQDNNISSEGTSFI